MFADTQTTLTPAHHSVRLSAALPDSEQHKLLPLLNLIVADNHLLAPSNDSNIEPPASEPALVIKQWVDGRNLACPMPLLKTKVALREVNEGESLYVVATDPNSRADITAFCQQSLQKESTDSLQLIVNEATNISAQSLNTKLPQTSFDTIYHFIITKMDSN